jgi:acyl-CoA thioester hydrolase
MGGCLASKNGNGSLEHSSLYSSTALVWCYSLVSFLPFDPTLPPARVHRQCFVVQPEDIDELEHVNNSVYLRYADTAAIAHATRIGMTFAAMKAAGNIPVVIEHHIKYHKSAVLGDTLEDTTWIATCEGIRSTRCHEIRREADGALLVQIKTDWVWLDASGTRPRRISPIIWQAFGFQSAAISSPE